MGSLFGPSAQEGKASWGPGPCRVPLRLVRSHRTSTTTVGLEPTFRNPRAHDPSCSASTTTMSHHEGPQTKSHHDQDQANRHDDCRTLVLTTSLLFLPDPRDFFPSHSPPDWTRGCRAISGLPSLVGAPRPCSPFAHWLEETLHALPRSGASI